MRKDSGRRAFGVLFGWFCLAGLITGPAVVGADEIAVKAQISDTETAELEGRLVAVRLEPFPDDPDLLTLFADLKTSVIDYQDPRLLTVRVRFGFEACHKAIEKAESDGSIDLPPSFPVVLIKEQYRDFVLFEAKDSTAFSVLDGPNCTPSKRRLPFKYIKEAGRQN